MGDITVASADATTVAELVTGMAAWPNRSQVLPPQISPGKIATANTPDPVLKAKEAVHTIEILDECLVVEICIDQYLWTLYQRTPKQDTIKVHEQRKVTVKKKRKMVTVTRTLYQARPSGFRVEGSESGGRRPIDPTMVAVSVTAMDAGLRPMW